MTPKQGRIVFLIFVLIGFFLAGGMALASFGIAKPAATAVLHEKSGLVFECSADQLDALQPNIQSYLVTNGIDLDYVQVLRQPTVLKFQLAKSMADGNTLDLSDRPELGIRDALLQLPTASKQMRTVLTVSKQEILYALMQSGRSNLFSGAACSLEALSDHVGLRQNIVAWADSLEWHWPDGDKAKWNDKYWTQGDLVSGNPLHAAVNDTFTNQQQYGIGCYTAAKLVMMQGVLDYFHRIKKDQTTLDLIEASLLKSKEPFQMIEPDGFWASSAAGVTTHDFSTDKLLALYKGASAKNFIPGDWAYFLNTDPVTYERTGYEGSNVIYLGRDKFVDYYNDNNHAYSYKEKIDTVFQWRNKVFSASRHVANVKPLSAAEIEHLSATPKKGGLLLNTRTAPSYYGFQSFIDKPD